MGSVFGEKPKKVTPPVPDPPQAVPVASTEAEDFAAKQQAKKSGATKAFLTGNLIPKSSGKKKTLG